MTERTRAAHTAAWDVRGFDLGGIETDKTMRMSLASDASRAARPVLPKNVVSADGMFELGKTIGERGMASVCLARRRGLGRDVAIKTTHPHIARRAAALLLREAQVGGGVQHPNLVHDPRASNDLDETEG